MELVYKNKSYLLVDESYREGHFKNFYLLFLNRESGNFVYTVQMAVNYIKKLDSATIDQEFIHQEFVACLPIDEYPEVIDYINNGYVELNIFEETKAIAKRLNHEVKKYLNSNEPTTSLQFYKDYEKITQYKYLLKKKKIELPNDFSEFENNYHIFLNKKRVYEIELRTRLKITKLQNSINYLQCKPILTNDEMEELESNHRQIEKLKNDLSDL